jgi:hypothetical protein
MGVKHFLEILFLMLADRFFLLAFPTIPRLNQLVLLVLPRIGPHVFLVRSYRKLHICWAQRTSDPPLVAIGIVPINYTPSLRSAKRAWLNGWCLKFHFVPFLCSIWFAAPA